MISCHDTLSFHKAEIVHASKEAPKLLELLKKDFSDQEKIQFDVDYYAESDNWAIIYVTPYLSNEYKLDPRWALFRRENGNWNDVDWSKGMVFESDFELIDLPIRNSRVAKLIVQKYPDCPMEIFPDK